MRRSQPCAHQKNQQNKNSADAEILRAWKNRGSICYSCVPTCVWPAVATLELLQLLLQLHLPPPLHHRLRVRDAPREARLRELTIELLGDSICSRSLVLLPVELGLFVVLLLLLLLPFRQLPFEAAALGRERVRRGVVLAVHARLELCGEKVVINITS